MGLKRVLGSVDAGWLVAGNMIGAGIFFTPGLVAERLPGLAAPLLAWTIGGLLALAGAAVYAELGVRLPRAGGDYQYLTVAFGPLWGFLTGWAGILLTFSAAAAAMCITAVDYLRAAASVGDAAPRGYAPIAAPLIILFLTFTNTVGARTAGRTTAWLTGVPIVGLLGLFGFGLLSGRVDAVLPPVPAAPTDSWLVAIGAALMPIYFTYSGWNAAAYLAGEIRRPERDLARGLLFGTAAVMLLYLAINTFLLLVVPREMLAGSTTAGAQAARILLGPGAERALSLLIAIAVLGSANVTLMAGARVYYAMAQDGLAPRVLGRTNAAGVPSASLWIAGVWTALLATSAGVALLVNWATLAILLLSSMAVASLFVLRRRGIGVSDYRCPGYPITPIVYLIVSLGVAWASAVRNSRESLYGVLLVGAGLPVYALMRRRLASGWSPAASSPGPHDNDRSET